MRGSVTVTGPPAAICRSNTGTTEPELAYRLPKRTTLPLGYVAVTSSASRFVTPIHEVGATALSVETTTVRAPVRSITSVPSTFVRRPSMALCGVSSSGTCLSAAAWMMRSSGRPSSRRPMAGSSRTSVRAGTTGNGAASVSMRSCSATSQWSSTSRLARSWAMSCRATSRPRLPPAPVTRTWPVNMRWRPR